ncbi:MAG: transglutaminase-like domain-containing protein, partial [Myxococcota bacterium]
SACGSAPDAPPVPERVPGFVTQGTPSPAPGESRRIKLTYTALVPARPVGSAPLQLWLPFPRTTDWQRSGALSVMGPAGVHGSEPVHGNRFWHGQVEATGEPSEVVAVFNVLRRPVATDFSKAEPRGLTEAERIEYGAYLVGSAKVPVGEDDEVLKPVLMDVRAKAPSKAPLHTTRAIYDHVIDTMEYKKVGTGWGHGDTYWACSEKYGNCTDYHSLFLSLARTEGIPARFEMGLPIPTDRPKGEIGGYHCWLRFWMPGVGWVPVDASEADKHPEQREALFGQQPMDRIVFTHGRDIRLGEDHQGPALNYFIYPYAEVGGEPVEVGHRFAYEVVE